jgi:hypothetical protein
MYSGAMQMLVSFTSRTVVVFEGAFGSEHVRRADEVGDTRQPGRG